MKKIDFKKFIPAVIILLVVVIGIVVACSSSKDKNDENPGDSNINSGKIKNEQSSNVSSNEEKNPEVQKPARVETDTEVPQENTSSTTEYVDNSGSTIAEATVEEIQDKIIEKFKTIPQDELKLKNVNLDTATFMFGEGIMSIAKKDCFGFSVYVLDGQYLVNAGMYAMSTDTEVLYRYDTDTLTYIFVPMK